jgi:hypothetical protein
MTTLFLFVTIAAAAAPQRADAVDSKMVPLTIDRVAWLHGCWQMTTPQSIVDEQWMAPRGGTMIGVGRTVRGGRTTDYEFVVLKEQNGALAYEAHPAGQPPAVFLASDATADTVVFENSAHDFPQRVGYRRADRALAAWIEGTQNGKARRIDFTYARVACAQ